MYNIILLLKFVACFSISSLVLFLYYTLSAYVSNPRVEQKVRLMLSEVMAEEGVATIILTSLKIRPHIYIYNRHWADSGGNITKTSLRGLCYIKVALVKQYG